jgi:hypothetical protein
MPWSRENSAGGGARRDANESSASVTSEAFRSEASISIWLHLVHKELIHFHGRIVASTTTDKLSFRIFAINNGIATEPSPIGSL